MDVGRCSPHMDMARVVIASAENVGYVFIACQESTKRSSVPHVARNTGRKAHTALAHAETIAHLMTQRR
jgi:hypothetical protein